MPADPFETWSASMLLTRCRAGERPTLVSAIVTMTREGDDCRLSIIGPGGRETVVTLPPITAAEIDAALTP